MPFHSNTYNVLIFDIGGVLLTWTYDHKSRNIDGHTFKKMLTTQTWNHLESGKLSDDDAYFSLSSQFGVDPLDIHEAVQHATDSLVCRSEMFDLIAALKPGRKVYAMSNMPSSQWETVKVKGASLWDLFDGVFISGDLGSRKPDFHFYQHVLRETGAIPEHTLFIDDTRDNIVTAKSLGIGCILYDTFPNVHRALLNLCGDPIKRASRFLVANAKKHHSFTSTGHIVHENVAQILLLEATNDPSLVAYTEFPAECNFFQGAGQFTTAFFPEDLDTTSIYWTVVPEVVPSRVRMRVMDKMLAFCNNDGIPLTYFDQSRPRRDHVVCVNVLSLFYAHGRGDELSNALDFVHSVLRTGAFSYGSIYYDGPDTFLYFVLRLLERAPSLTEYIGDLLKERCQERIGSSGDALALAMRVHCCTRLDIKAEVDLYRLLAMQQVDGGWEGGYIYGYASSNLQIENRGLTTAISLRALKEYHSKFA